MIDRSARREGRNPVLALPAARELQRLALEAREALRAVLGEIASDAGERAERSWRQKKGIMAAYWKAVSIYAKHIRAAMRPGRV